MLKFTPLTNVALGFFFASAVGCQPTETASDPMPERAGDQAALDPDTMETAPAAVTVQIKSWEEVQQMVADLSGQVVLIDIWSTWCVPCTVKFPEFVKLQEAYPEGLTCISVAANYTGLPDEPPESFRDEVLDFLRRQNAAFPNVISSTPDQELYSIVGADAVPIALLYGPDGQLVKMFTNEDPQFGDEGFTYADHVQPLVEELLAADAGS
jgi:thiol-disulfide isomerase/thioredoxin